MRSLLAFWLGGAGTVTITVTPSPERTMKVRREARTLRVPPELRILKRDEMQVVKDPAARLDYHEDWSEWLGDDTIQSSTWTVANGLKMDSPSATDTVTSIWFSAGRLGKTHEAANEIVTVAGRRDVRRIYVRIAQK